MLVLGLGLPALAAGEEVDFNFQVRPLLSDRCFACHGPDSRARKKDLRLDTKKGLFKKLEEGLYVVKPGDINQSELVRRIFATDDDQMPPDDPKWSETVTTENPVSAACLTESVQSERRGMTGKRVRPNRKLRVI